MRWWTALPIVAASSGCMLYQVSYEPPQLIVMLPDNRAATATNGIDYVDFEFSDDDRTVSAQEREILIDAAEGFTDCRFVEFSLTLSGGVQGALMDCTGEDN